MREVVELSLAQLWIVLHHRYIALVCAIIFCCVGWTVIEFIPDKYQAETKVYLDTQSVLKRLLQGLAVANSSQEQSAQVMQRTLITRPNMQKVILETDLNLTINGPIETEQMVDHLMQTIKISSVSLLKGQKGGSNLYRISYTDDDPVLAKDVIVVLLNIFVESILGESRKDSHDAEEFLDEQIREYEKRQYEAEERLKLFKQRNMGVMPQEGKSYYQEVISLGSKIEETNLALVETENRIVELKRQIKSLVTSLSSLGDESENTVLSPLDKRINDMEAKLDDLLLQYTENHPDVINAKLILEQLRQKKIENRQNIDPDAESVDSDVLTLPLYQELNVMLGAAQSEAVALRTRVQRFEQQKAEKENLLKTVSEVEAELQNLDRNYAINKKMYGDLVLRREASKLAVEADESGDKLQFKIIEPPRIPHLPSSPNRPWLTTLTLLAAFGAAIGVAILYEQMKPTFYTSSQLMESVELPVLGTVSMFWTNEERRKRRIGFIFFGVVNVFLLGAYLAVLIHNGFNIQPYLP